jgi:hypothetical protein
MVSCGCSFSEARRRKACNPFQRGCGKVFGREGDARVTDGKERRKHPRITVRWPVSVITDVGLIEGETRNITPEGVFIHSKERLVENHQYQLIVKLPKHQPIVVRGRLIWSNLEECDDNSLLGGMGFSFVKVSEEDRRYLEKVISIYGTKSAK